MAVPLVSQLSSTFNGQDVFAIVGAYVGISCVCIFAIAIYNIYFHPLSHIPGPKLAAISRIPYSKYLLRGSLHRKLEELHARYGEVVRIAPNEVSFISGETAWADIYGFRKGDKGSYLKDLHWFPEPMNSSRAIISVGDADHSRHRRLLAHAFSDKALREQEPLIQGYVDLLVYRLREQMQTNPQNAMDLSRWYNYTTFDIIADLTLGKPFYCLRDKDYHPFVLMVFQAAKALGFMTILRYYPLLGYLGQSLIPRDAIEKRIQFFTFTVKSVDERMAQETDRPDFIKYIMRHQDEKGMSLAEIHSNANLFLIAGSETTATMLTGTTYLLLKNPDKLEKLTEEVRSRFKRMDEITIEEVNKLPYLLAVLSEGLRYFPPVPTGFPRVVPAGGDTISGYWIPENTSVYVSQHASNHSKRNFVDPDMFVPERFLDDPRYAADKKAVLQPFSFGPRNCLGKNLAYAEMRLIMAKMVWSFDLELSPESDRWMDQNKLYTLWEKPPLMVKLKEVSRP